MSNKSLKHFILTRFFPKQDLKYLYNVLSPNFLKSQFVLAKNIFRSLENQTNKNFELVFITHTKFFDDPKYEFVFKTLQDSTALPLTFIRQKEITPLVQAAYNKYDFVIQSRMDFDDFIYKDAVEDTQSKINECPEVLAYGYCKGYMYEDGNMYPYKNLYNGIGHPAVLQSYIWSSDFAKKLPFIDVYFCPHTKAKLKLKELLEKNGLEFSKQMFQQNKSVSAFVYTRHEFSHNSLTNNITADYIVKRDNLKVIEDIDEDQLAEQFGFELKLNYVK